MYREIPNGISLLSTPRGASLLPIHVLCEMGEGRNTSYLSLNCYCTEGWGWGRTKNLCNSMREAIRTRNAVFPISCTLDESSCWQLISLFPPLFSHARLCSCLLHYICPSHIILYYGSFLISSLSSGHCFYPAFGSQAFEQWDLSKHTAAHMQTYESGSFLLQLHRALWEGEESVEKLQSKFQ